MLKDALNAVMIPVGLCDPANLRLVWANPALERLLLEHSLDQNLSVRAIVPDLPLRSDRSEANEGRKASLLVREEASLPAHNETDATSASCQLGPLIEVSGDRLLMFQVLKASDTDSARATLNIFSRHMNTKVAAWEQERDALLQQIQDLKRES